VSTNNQNFNAENFLQTLTHRPGVYRMLDEAGAVIYVGKARDLKKRVASYFGSKAHHPKTMALMERARKVEVTVTASEREALLLELNLIKQHQPYFNVLLRDGKGYPFIHVSTADKYPRFSFHRGARKGKGRYLGPYPNSAAVRQTLSHVQKLFQVRQCEDSFFSNRTRPCLQHQIKRCSAPCVKLISEEDYRRDVNNTVLFLEGKDHTVVSELADRMDHAAEHKDYEQAALLRDQIAAIKALQAKQSITDERKVDTDAIATFSQNGSWAIATVMVRGGRVLGSRHFSRARRRPIRPARSWRLLSASTITAGKCHTIYSSTQNPMIRLCWKRTSPNAAVTKSKFTATCAAAAGAGSIWRWPTPAKRC
jgi:excinuclease ABC subunit C